MNIYWQELRMSWRSAAVWIVALSLVVALFLTIYPSFVHDAEASRKLFENFPPPVRALLGVTLDTFFTFLGFYSYLLTYISLAGAVQAMNLGITMLNREAVTGTSDFLLTRPVRRTTVFMAKLASALSILAVTNVLVISVTILLARAFGVDAYDRTTFLLLALSFFLMQLMFLAIGIVTSQIMGRVRSVISVSLGVTIAFFAIGLLQSISNDDALRYVTPFKFFLPMSILTDHSYEAAFVWLTLAVILVPIIIAYYLYVRRDVRSAS